MVNNAKETAPEHGVTSPALSTLGTDAPEETETTEPAKVMVVVAASRSRQVFGVQFEDTHPLMPAAACDSSTSVPKERGTANAATNNQATTGFRRRNV